MVTATGDSGPAYRIAINGKSVNHTDLVTKIKIQKFRAHRNLGVTNSILSRVEKAGRSPPA